MLPHLHPTCLRFLQTGDKWEGGSARGDFLLSPGPLAAPWLLPGFLKELEQELSRLREHRQQEALADHLLRMETKPTLTSLPPLPPGVPMAGDSSPSAMPTQGKETAPEAPASSLASSPTKKSCPLIPRHQLNSQARKGSHVATAPKTCNPTKTATKRVKK